MLKGLIGKKIGMTQIFDEKGVAQPVTIIEAGPCFVTQVRNPEKDGYSAVQLGFGEVHPKRLTGGELGAMVVLDAVARLVPGVLDEQSTLEESHSDSLLEYPHYTRPAVWEGREVPHVLLSGHHGQVAAWRQRERSRRTLERRPDMLAHANLKQADKDYLQSLGWQPPA